MAENFKEKIDTIGSEEAPSFYNKSNISQKLIFWKLISTSP